jgi:hypothetical protein
MKIIKQIILYLVIPGSLLISCSNTREGDINTNADRQSSSVTEKIIGTWKITDPSGDPDKTLNYVFEKDKSGYKYPGSNPFLVKAETFDYIIDANDSTVRIKMMEEKSGETIFRLKHLDEQKMKIVIETANNNRTNDSKEKEMIKINQ